MNDAARQMRFARRPGTFVTNGKGLGAAEWCIRGAGTGIGLSSEGSLVGGRSRAASQGPVKVARYVALPLTVTAWTRAPPSDHDCHVQGPVPPIV
jgi:hypothetical protein